MTVQTRVALLSAPHGHFRGTAAEAIGAPDGPSRRAAATAAGIDSFLCELPAGYHTPIGEGGVVLTPAQRLRLTVARLLALDPPSVVVDGPTAELDAAAEAGVLPSLAALFRGRDVVLVTASPAVREIYARTALYRRSVSSCAAGPYPSSPALQRLPRDPTLPCLPELLDATVMAPLLTRNGGGVPDVRVHSVRYKPGDNAVVQYSVGGPAGWSTAVAYATAGPGLDDKLRKHRNYKLSRRVTDRTAQVEPLSYLPDVSALVQWLPLDVRLPLLSDSGSRLARRLAKKGVAVSGDEEPEVIRYWPRRRAVLRLGSHVLKVYRDPTDFAVARHGLGAAAALDRVRTAVFEAVLPSQQTTVQALLPGTAPLLWPDSSEAAGSVLADLHAHSGLRLSRTTTDEILVKSAVRAAFLADLLPDLRGEVASLVALLGKRAPAGLPWVTSHGNFHAGQLVAGREGLALIDLDRLCLAAPAYDLASFAAHLAFGRAGDMEVVTSTLDSLLRGYGARPDGLEWFLSSCLLRRAHVPFRYLDEHWPEAVADLIASAREALR